MERKQKMGNWRSFFCKILLTSLKGMSRIEITFANLSVSVSNNKRKSYENLSRAVPPLETLRYPDISVRVVYPYT